MYYISKGIIDKLWASTAAASAKASRFTRYLAVGLVSWLLVTAFLKVVDTVFFRVEDKDGGSLSFYLMACCCTASFSSTSFPGWPASKKGSGLTCCGLSGCSWCRGWWRLAYAWSWFRTRTPARGLPP
jgi:hypothetical protein